MSSLLDRIISRTSGRRASSLPPQAQAHIDAAIDAVTHAAYDPVLAAPQPLLGPLPPPLPSPSAPTDAAATPQPTPERSLERMHSDSTAERHRTNSESAPKRARKRTKGSLFPPLVRIERTEKRLPVEANQPSARAQALYVLHCMLRRSDYQAGQAVPYEELKAIYHEVCGKVGWQAVGWSGGYGIGTQFRKLCGGGKPYLNSWLGTEPTYSLCKRGPKYVLPQLSDLPGLDGAPITGGGASGTPGRSTVTQFPRTGRGRAA